MARPFRMTDSMSKSLDPSWLQCTFSDLWSINARELKDKEAIVDSKNRFTWAEADRWISRMARGLVRLGYNKDDCVVIQLPNCVELPLLRVACERAGLIGIPISRNLKGKEVEYILNKVGARMYVSLWRFRNVDYFAMIEEMRESLNLDRVMIVGKEVPPGAMSVSELLAAGTDDGRYEGLIEKRKCVPEEFSLVTHTSGSTGFPKFVENPVFSRMELARAQRERLKIVSSDIIGLLSPTAGGPNTIGYFTAPLAGAKVVMIEHFEPEEVMKRIEKEKITVITAVPTMIITMVDHPKFKEYDLSSLRLIVVAGAAFHYHEALQAEEAIGCPIVQFYGSVDCGLGLMSGPDDSRDVRLKTVGRPVGITEIRLMADDGSTAPSGEEGEVLIRSLDNATGYYMDPETNHAAWDEEGWFKMGDIGRVDGAGNLTIIGRKKDVIIRGGQNIIPGEIERFLTQHEKVAQAAVIGMPDRIMGERVCAYVIPHRGEGINMDELNALLMEKKVAFYKLLERMEIVEAFPLTGEKVDKKALLRDITEKLTAS